MSKPGETTEDREEEEENEKTRESPQTVGSTTTQPPGGGREEKSEDGPSSDEPSATVLDAVEDLMPDDADEQDKEMNVKNSTATVKVLLVPGGHVMTMAFAIGLTIEEIKHHLASELKVPLEVLQLYLNAVLDAVEDQMPDDADEQDKEMNVKREV